ncbi:Sm protein [Trichomonas vaginalis G3]|uniref:Sm protein G n=1 Tax=Trichomonas vaginalis (strain ATCC PRA-98 / G3) TaxID=412133 RepID=A2GMH6_TRIV3|nr:small nuclear ribonucleoprotein G family [Trichomonas vaginalis G3]EAX81640.1 Sm protein [Trichomonas vaginalis G3]KAI5543220.1 small nuclear ribonucleoprotein G family [Trichomonas vaginalis G3]|eukprot:XP_001294570.1 Sm protein [Trichomonas vaginalis G3]
MSVQMTQAQPPYPELKGHLQKKVKIMSNKDREVSGILTGFDHFMNLTIRDAQIKTPYDKAPVFCNSCVIRGTMILSVETLN